jgi:hypothetical protein
MALKILFTKKDKKQERSPDQTDLKKRQLMIEAELRSIETTVAIQKRAQS